MVFPVIQALTGKDPRGTRVDGSDKGHFEETDDRLSRVETNVEDLSESVEKLQKRQDRHNRKTEYYLRRVVSNTEGIDEEELDEPLFRGGGSGVGRSDPVEEDDASDEGGNGTGR